MPELSPLLWVAVGAIGLLAGTVKGATGFAMPLILISGLGSILPPETALAGLIFPTLLSNVWQSLRGGVPRMLAAASGHWVFVSIVLVMILLSAQLVRALDDGTMFLLIGVPVVVLCIVQILGWLPRIRPAARRPFEVVLAVIAGFMGGLSGIWGPPTVIYLTALDTPKDEHVAVQGICYGMGSVALMAAHIRSGLFDAGAAGFSALICIPALIGVAAGFRVHDRLDQAKFRKVTLIVLALVGLNLVRRGLTG